MEIFNKATKKQKTFIIGYFAVVLVLILAGFSQAQMSSLVGAQITPNERIYRPGEVYEKTFYITPNQTYISAGTEIDPYCVEPTKGYIIIQRSVFSGIMQYKSYPNEMFPLGTQITNGVAVSITLRWEIPSNAASGTYITAIQLAVIPCDTIKSKVMGFEGEYVTVAVGMTTTTRPTTITTTTRLTTTTTPYTTTTLCYNWCGDGKCFGECNGIYETEFTCPIDCKPQPQNILVYIVLAIIAIIVIFSLLKHYKKI